MRKQNSLKLLLCIFLLGCLGVTRAWGTDVTYKLTIQTSDFNTTSYAANDGEHTTKAVCTTDANKTKEVKWTSSNVMKASSAMQWRDKSGSMGTLYNSTDLGKITNVSITKNTSCNSSATFTTYYGTSANPTSGTTVGNGYFTVKVSSATGLTDKIEITFTVSESGGGSGDEPAALTTMSDVISDAKSGKTMKITLDDWVVTGVSGDMAYIADKDNAYGITVNCANHGFKAGDKLSGMVSGVTSQYYNSIIPELTNLTSSYTGLTVSTGGSVTAQEVSFSDLDVSKVGTVITLKKVIYNSDYETLEDPSNRDDNYVSVGDELTTSISWTSETYYNATGVYVWTSGTSGKYSDYIYPRSADDVSAVPTYSAKFFNNGSDYNSNDYIVGADITFPDDPTPPNDDYAFMGWSTTSVTTTDTKPTMVTSATMEKNGKNFYAVFAKKGSGGSGYRYVTSLTAGKKYVFATKNSAGSAYALSSSVTSGTSVTVAASGDDKVISGTIANSIVWNVSNYTSISGSYSLQNVGSTTVYLKINGSSVGTNSSDYPSFWSSSYGLYGKSNSGTGSNSYYLQCSSGTFSKGSSSSSNRVYAFEEYTTTSYSGYTTTVVNSSSVTLNANGGTFAEGKNVTEYVEGTGVTLPSATDISKTGYTFKGWFDNEELTGTAVTAIGTDATGDKEYWAKWEVNLYAVTLNKNNENVENDGGLYIYYGQSGYDVDGSDEFDPVTAPTGFDVKGYYTTIDGTIKVVNADGTLISGIEGWTDADGKWINTDENATLYAQYSAEAQSRTVTWYVNNAVYTTGNPTTGVKDGNKVTTLPTEPESTDATSTTFMGWTDTQISTKQSAAPDVLFKTAEDAPEVNGADVNYYAVFAKESSTAGWNQVTTLAGIVAGTYVIKNDAYVLPSTTTTSAPSAVDAPTVSNGKITGTVESSMEWILTSTGTDNQFYVKNADGSYLYETNNNSGLRVSTTSDKWTFTTNTTGYFSMKGANNSRYCAKYSSGSDWRSYTSATADNYANSGKLELYKKSGGEPSYSDYVTECKAKAAAPTFSLEENTYTSAQSLEISAEDGATIYYNINSNDDPTTESSVYSTAIPLNTYGVQTIKAMAVVEGRTNSDVVSKTYTMNLPFNSVADMLEKATNTDATLNVTNAYIHKVYTTGSNKQVFIQEANGKGIILATSADLPSGIVAGNQLTGSISGYCKINNGRPQLGTFTLAEGYETSTGTRPTPVELTAIDEMTADANLLKLVEVKNIYPISEASGDLITMNSQSDNKGTAYTIYDIWSNVNKTLPETDEACNVIGLFNYNGTSYNIIPLQASDFSTVSPRDAELPTIDLEGSTNSASPLEVATNKVIKITKPTTNYTGSYTFGGNTTTMTASSYTVTITSTDAAESLTLTGSRPYYNDKSITYYYKANAALNEYSITYPSVQTYVGVTGVASAIPGTTVELTGSSKVQHYYPGVVTVYKTGDETTTVDVVKDGNNYTFTMPAYNVTIKQGYTKDPTYGVTYLKNGKQTTPQTEITEDAQFENTVLTLKECIWSASGVEFDGWKAYYVDETDGDKEVELTITDNTITIPAHDVKIYAQWANVYSVTFAKGEATDATGDVPTESLKRKDATVTLPANPFTLTGYSFKGWLASTDGKTYQANDTYTMTAANVTFTAQWNTADYKKAGAWELVTDANQLEAGAYYVMAQNESGVTATTTITSTTSGSNNKYLDPITTTFSEDKSKITTLGDGSAIFQLGGATDAWTLTEVSKNQYFIMTYVSTGSNYNPIFSNTDDSKWKIAISQSSATATMKYNSSTFNEHLIKYNTGGGFKPYKTSSTTMSPIQLYRFYRDAKEVSFDANTTDEVLNMPSKQKADPDNDKVKIPNNVPTRVGYTFSKWNSAKGGSGVVSANPNDEITLTQASTTLYAVWTKNTPELTVATVEHGTISAKPYGMAEMAEGSSANVEYGKTVVISHTDDNDAYAFKGWKIYKTGDESTTITPVVGQTSTTFDMPDYPVTISATYQDKTTIQCKLTYDANGGTLKSGVTQTEYSYTYNTPAPLQGEIFEKSQCVFTGWNTAADGSGKSRVSGGTYTMTEDVTLYAQWKATGVTYELDNASDNDIKVEDGVAPSASTAKAENTNTSIQVEQVTQGNTLTITLSGFAGKFITDIAADMKANYSGNGTLDIAVGGKSIYSTTYPTLGVDNSSSYFNRSLKDYDFKTIYVEENQDIVIKIASSYKSAYFQNLKISYSDPDYSRDLTGSIGTICLDHGVDAGDIFGVTFFEGDYLLVKDNQPYKYYLKEVDHLEAGYPYVFQKDPDANDAKLAVLYNSTVDKTAKVKVGLTGTLSDILDYAAGDERNKLENNYFIYENTFRQCGAWCGLYANRAYLDITKIADENKKTYVDPSSQIGVRQLILTNAAAPTSPTGLNEASAEHETSEKFFQNGKLFIHRNGQLYNAAGQLVK